MTAHSPACRSAGCCQLPTVQRHNAVGYFGTWSIGTIGAPATTSPLWKNPALRTRLGLEVGGGTSTPSQSPGSELTAAGIPFSDARLDAGHEWYTWRQLLYDYATTVAFRHTTTTIQVAAPRRHFGWRRLIATVSGDTTEPVPPAGRFSSTWTVGSAGIRSVCCLAAPSCRRSEAAVR
jgi:hypothetical protein